MANAPAQGIDARSDETRNAAQPLGLEPGREAMRQDSSRMTTPPPLTPEIGDVERAAKAILAADDAGLLDRDGYPEREAEKFAIAALAHAESPAPAPSPDEDDPCPNGSHCCCCGPGEPCCDCGQVMPSKACVGEKCWCGAPAAKKVGEEIAFDDPSPHRHNLTAYVCARHYAELMGPVGAKQVGFTAPAPSLDIAALREWLRAYAEDHGRCSRVDAEKVRETLALIERLTAENARLRSGAVAQCPFDDPKCKVEPEELCPVCGASDAAEPGRCVNEVKPRLEAAEAKLAEARAALEPFAKQPTIDEILAGEVPSDWADASAERRIEMMGERKRENTANILRARAALATIDGTATPRTGETR